MRVQAQNKIVQLEKEKVGVEKMVSLCLQPTESQKHTLQVLAKIVDVPWTECEVLYLHLKIKDSLNLKVEKISDLSPLQGLTQLVSLGLESNRVLLFPHLRRFGKTTNLSMLRYFFENLGAKESHKSNLLMIDAANEIPGYSNKPATFVAREFGIMAILSISP